MIALFGLALLAATPVVDTPEREADGLSQQLTETRDPVKAAALLLRIGELLPSLGHLPELQQAIETAAARPQIAGEASALLQRFAAGLLIARGRPERAAEAASELGLVQSVSVLGPLEWNATQVCGIAGPVPPITPPAGPTSWRPFPNIAPLGRLAIDDLISDRRDEAGVVAFGVTVPRAVHAALYYGASAPTAIALNGRWIADDPTQHAEHFGQLRVALDLPAGESTIEVQLCRADRPLQISLRLADERGRPLRGATLGLPKPQKGHNDPRGKPRLRPAEMGGLLFNQAQSHDDMESEAIFSEQLGLFDDRSREAVRTRTAACADHPSVRCYVALAHDQELVGDTAARRAALDSAQALVGDPKTEVTERTALERAESKYGADLGYPDRALQHARAALDLDPNDSRSDLAVAQALEAFGMTGLAGQVELTAAERWPESPEILTAACYRLERLRREGDALLLLRREIALRDDLLGAHEALHRLLLRQGNLDAALDQLSAIRRLIPASARPWLDEGKLLLANPLSGPEGAARHERAEAAFAVALSLASADPDVMGEIAAAELRDGDSTRGRSTLARALALAPQAPALRALDQAGGASREEGFTDGELKDLRKVALANLPTPGADAVSLSDTTVVKVYDSGLSSRVHQSIIRVQTERGAEGSRTFPIEYSPDRQELRIESARVLKASGEVVPSYQESSRSLSEPWYDLYYDLREDDLTFPSLAPGDVVEVTYRLDDSARENLISRDFGDLIYLQDSLERRSIDYVVIMPKGRKLFASAPDLSSFTHRVGTRPDGTQVHRFSARNVPALQNEPQMPGYGEVAPYLHVSTRNDWGEVGDYFWSLAKDQLAPSPQLKEIARQLSAKAGSDPAARVAAAYDYVVSYTRYVGLEFGIHGYKPYPVSEVLSRGFGDCKDKASLLVALLREVGIEADLVLIRTRHQGRLADLPASLSVFDHAIVYVPSMDRFLDGTARFYGSTELPTEDQGASALIIEADGKSRLILTPTLEAARNTTDTNLTFKLTPEGGAEISGHSRVIGALAPSYRQSYASDVGQRGSFETAWSRSYPGIAVRSLKFSDLGQLEKPVELTFELVAPRLALQPNEFRPFGLSSGYLEAYAPLSRRNFDLQLDFPFTTRFDYRCLPPPQRKLLPPPDVHLISPFGSLDVTYHTDESGAVDIAGQLILAAIRIKPSGYAEFRDFLRKVDHSFEAPLVLAPGGDHAER